MTEIWIQRRDSHNCKGHTGDTGFLHPTLFSEAARNSAAHFLSIAALLLPSCSYTDLSFPNDEWLGWPTCAPGEVRLILMIIRT